MTETPQRARARLRELLTDAPQLVRAVASGRLKGATPDHVKTELRPVSLKTGLKLQIARHDGQRPVVSNVDFSDEAALDAVLAQPYRNWLIETTGATIQLRFTKRGDALIHTAPASRNQELAHDRTPPHLIAADDPLFAALGAGAAKRRQVDAFLRAVEPSLRGARGPLRVTDLGCGNAYLTFAMYRYLDGLGLAPEVTGVDIRDDQRERNTALAAELGYGEKVRFAAGTIADAPLEGVDVVLALHACDTATDDALARGVKLGAGHIFAAPCCHHDVAAQLRRASAPAPYGSLTTDGILRERFADVLTDALRAALLRLHGYTVDVIEFIDSAHTPRNTLLRATRTGAAPDPQARREYEALVAQWNVKPHLATLLEPATSAEAS